MNEYFLRRAVGLFGFLLVGVAVGHADAPKTTTAYYYGAVKYFASDGTMPLGESKSLVKRTVDFAAGRIVEIVTRPGRNPGDKSAEFTTELKRMPGKNEFHVTDSAKEFTGTMKFDGPEWNRWTYDLKLKDGSTITGDGSVSSTGMLTNKTVDYVDRAAGVVREDLKAIPEAEYNKRHKDILGK